MAELAVLIVVAGAAIVFMVIFLIALCNDTQVKERCRVYRIDAGRGAAAPDIPELKPKTMFGGWLLYRRARPRDLDDIVNRQYEMDIQRKRKLH